MGLTRAKGISKVLTVSILLSVATYAPVLTAEPDSLPGGPIATQGGEFPFDPNNQDFSVVVYDCGSYPGAIDQALDSLGILRYTVRYADRPVTLADLDANDILIVEYYEPYFGNMAGLDPNILPTGITGRIVITGHDPDFHFGARQAAAKFLENAIRWVLADPGTGLIILADKSDSPFLYLQQAWGIYAVSPYPKDDYNDEYIDSFTDAGLVSGLFTGLDCNDMSYWHDSFHDVFTAWNSDFVPMELGGASKQDVITLARGNVYDISLTITTDVDPNTCVDPDTEIIYTLSYSYPYVSGRPDVHNVVIVDTLPPGVDYEYFSSSGDYDPGTHTLTWDIGTLEPGESNSVSFTVTVNDNSEP